MFFKVASPHGGPQRSHQRSKTGFADGPPVRNGFVDFTLIGEALHHLARSTDMNIWRKFPTSLVTGQPNLLVVPHNEVLPTLIGLYMGSHATMPLPSVQEILWCSLQTTAEEVATFWSRAIFDPNGRVFSLIGADSLSIDIGRQTVNKLLDLYRSQPDMPLRKFHLVIICSKQDVQQLSPVAYYLNEFRRHPLRCPSNEEIGLFLGDHLRNEKQQSIRMDFLNTPSLTHSVQIVSSRRSGVGKSTFIESSATRARNIIPRDWNSLCSVPRTRNDSSPVYLVVPLHGNAVDMDMFVATVQERCKAFGIRHPKIVHIDVSPLVRRGLDRFLFNLVILRQVSDSSGRVWRRYATDVYVIEWTETTSSSLASPGSSDGTESNPFVGYLPFLRCDSPRQLLDDLNQRRVATIPAHVETLFCSSDFQRAVQYLQRLNTDLGRFRYTGQQEPSRARGLETVLNYCVATDPFSWADIKHYVRFLSYQLQSMEISDFCIPESLESLPGFKEFVLKFMIRMSRDFSAPSLNISQDTTQGGDSELAQHQLCRTWEKSEHPYLFFNKDRATFSFVGMVVDQEGCLINPASPELAPVPIMSKELRGALAIQGCNLQEDYRVLNRPKRMDILVKVMGVADSSFCDDPTYELTSDNMMKMLAIEMRLQCGIPVVILGETGCGKTRLIQFMCRLKAGITDLQNLVMKNIHGGVTRQEILHIVEYAERLATENEQKQPGMTTVLFFDEANTTGHIGLIKEIICDRRINGRLIAALGKSLRVIAACNPYRCHGENMIRRLEAAGLGYAVKDEDTHEKFGETPLRHLVYRVQPLPESLQRLVWDFGQLKPETEKLYIEQLVEHYLEREWTLSTIEGYSKQLTNVLAASQDFMRRRTDECSFVSIRDVERTLLVVKWFHDKYDVLEPLLEEACSRFDAKYCKHRQTQVSALGISIILALGVCYYARLHDRQPYRECVYGILRLPPLSLQGGPDIIEKEIRLCQEVFLDQLELPPRIGRSRALCENVFMMVVCINLRIPLFLVGKPGSSKNLAKDLVKAAMRDTDNPSRLFRELRRVQMVSYQCSRKSTAASIIKIFQRGEQIQKTCDPNSFVVCVVLDEVGLAEDSPHMPLKVLHPLLDEGTRGMDFF